MARIDQDPPRNHLKSSVPSDASSDFDSDDSDSPAPLIHDVGSAIDIGTIKSARQVEHTIAHRVEAGRSILALVVDQEYLFAGLEGGEITVRGFATVLSSRVYRIGIDPVLINGLI
jgi:hypothetical protein